VEGGKAMNKKLPWLFTLLFLVTNAFAEAQQPTDSLTCPGGNITGLTRLTRDLSGKRLELLKEVVPTISRVGILRDVNVTEPAIAVKEYEAAAPALKLQLQSLEVRGPSPDLEGAFLNDPSRLKNFSSQALAQADALTKLLIEHGLISREEFMQKLLRSGLRIRNW
jgi:hypothetical protein